MSDFVSAAAPSAGITWADYKGALIIFEPISQEVGVATVHGSADPVRANAYIITGPGESEDYEDTLVFPKVLAGQLKSKIGKRVVGRLGQGNAKPGQSAPWILEEATPDDLSKAQEWLKGRARPAVESAQAPF